VLGAGWIAAVVETLDDDGATGAVGSLCHAPEDATWVQRAYDRLRGRQVGRQAVEWLGAGNMAVTRAAFERVGGFDGRFETCEDVDLCKRLRVAGFALMGDDRLINVHLGDPATLGALFRGELWRGRSNLAVSLRWPFTLRDLPSAVAPIVQLAALGLGVASLFLTGAAAAVAWVVAALPWAIVPVVRVARMSTPIAHVSPRDIADNAAVAYVYDLARALALVSFAGHAVRRR
jgi:hypothetical protein